jgi:signal transduction histidine kinase
VASSSGGPGEGLAARERRFGAVIRRWGPYVGLAIGTSTSLFAITPGPSFWPVTLVLVLVAAGWAYLFTGRQELAASPGPGAVYLAGMLVLAVLLVHQSPFYGFYSFVGYYHSFEYLRGRWRWTGIVATAVVTAYSQLGGGLVDLSPAVLLAVAGLGLVNALLASGFTYYSSLTAELSARRQEENAELAEANRRLSETLDENAELHAQLLAQAREAGVADERARLAREIHDTIAQGLTGVVTQLEAAGAADDEPEARRRHIDTASALARESLTEARRSVEALAPGRLAEARLPDAIAGMAKKWAEQAEVEVVLDTTGDPRPLLPDIEVTLFRVAQEALTNVAKHAAATRAGLTLSYMDDVVILDIRDDGRGFVRGPAAGFGLAGMEQRVRRVSGTLSVESEPGEGTAISASVPAIPACDGSGR